MRRSRVPVPRLTQAHPTLFSASSSPYHVECDTQSPPHSKSGTARRRCTPGCREGREVESGRHAKPRCCPNVSTVPAQERKGAMTAGRLIICAMTLGLFAGGVPARAEPRATLPTPRSHYETFTPGISGVLLLQNLLQSLD